MDNFLNDRHVGGNGWRWDQADASHHGVYWSNKAQSGVKSRDTQRFCRTDRRTTTKNNTDRIRSARWNIYTPLNLSKAILNRIWFFKDLPRVCKTFKSFMRVKNASSSLTRFCTLNADAWHFALHLTFPASGVSGLHSKSERRRVEDTHPNRPSNCFMKTMSWVWFLFCLFSFLLPSQQ